MQGLIEDQLSALVHAGSCVLWQAWGTSENLGPGRAFQWALTEAGGGGALLGLMSDPGGGCRGSCALMLQLLQPPQHLSPRDAQIAGKVLDLQRQGRQGLMRPHPHGLLRGKLAMLSLIVLHVASMQSSRCVAGAHQDRLAPHIHCILESTVEDVPGTASTHAGSEQSAAEISRPRLAEPCTLHPKGHTETVLRPALTASWS